MSTFLRKYFLRPRPELRELADLPAPASEAKPEIEYRGGRARVIYVAENVVGRGPVELAMEGVEWLTLSPSEAGRRELRSYPTTTHVPKLKAGEVTISDLTTAVEDGDQPAARRTKSRGAEETTGRVRHHLMITFQDSVLECVCSKYSITHRSTR